MANLQDSDYTVKLNVELSKAGKDVPGATISATFNGLDYTQATRLEGLIVGTVTEKLTALGEQVIIEMSKPQTEQAA